MYGNRLIAFAAWCTLLVLAACTSLAGLGDQVTFTPAQLQERLDKRFPRDYDKFGGLVTLSVLHPRLTIPQDSQRLQLDFDVGFGAMGNDSHAPAGHIAVSSGLRYDPASHALFLDQPTLESAQVPTLGGALGGAGRELVDRWLADYARREPVYTFDASLLERLGARRIASTTIADGLVIVHLDHP